MKKFWVIFSFVFLIASCKITDIQFPVLPDLPNVELPEKPPVIPEIPIEPEKPIIVIPTNWIEFNPGESVTVPFKERIIFWTKGIDSTQLTEMHIIDYTEDIHKLVSNMHVTVFGCQIISIHQNYIPKVSEQHIPDDLCFDPTIPYKWIVDMNTVAFRLQIFENGIAMKVDTNQGLTYFTKPLVSIEQVRIGAGTFGGKYVPNGPISFSIENENP